MGPNAQYYQRHRKNTRNYTTVTRFENVIFGVMGDNFQHFLLLHMLLQTRELHNRRPWVLLLMLHAIKINCIYINEQVASIVSCNLRYNSELERHLGPAFSVTPARRTLFLAARNFEPAARILYRLINMYQLKILSCTSHLVTMSAMPPVYNYITIYIFIEKS